jgi:DedD protein
MSVLLPPPAPCARFIRPFRRQAALMSRLFALIAAILLVVLSAGAQEAGTPLPDSTFVLAQRLVAEGQADSGRAVIAGVLRDAAPGSPRYIDALYWRASLAATDADAERDYRRIIIEYPLSPREEDALVGMAQLEMARGQKTQALAHLRRLLLEHPASRSRARADFWMARVLFEDSANVAGGCTRLDDAKQVLPADDIEFRNRIEFYAQRCAGVARKEPEPIPTQLASGAAVAPTPTASAAPAVASNSGVRPAGDSASVADSVAMRSATAIAPASPPTVARPDSATATSTPATSPPATSTAATSAAAVAPAATPATATPSQPRKAATPATVTAQPTRHAEYTVQVAAYASRALADKLRSSLATRGYRARVVGTGAPYRVRVGRYPSREAALAAAQKMRAKKITAYVTEAEAP